MNQFIRSFIAIPLSAQVRQCLTDFCREHGLDNRSSGLRLVNPANIHLTMKFLGEIDPAKVPLLKTALDEVASQLAPFTVEIRGIGAYPNWRNRPRVIWVGVCPAPPLEKVFSKIDSATRKLGFPSEDRRFSPHLTLARVPAPTHPQSALPVLEKLMNLSPEPCFGEMGVARIAFYKSMLQPGGPVYTVLSSHQFVL